MIGALLAGLAIFAALFLAFLFGGLVAANAILHIEERSPLDG